MVVRVIFIRASGPPPPPSCGKLKSDTNLEKERIGEKVRSGSLGCTYGIAAVVAVK